MNVYVVLLWLVLCCYFFFFKQKTAYEMRISDWSSDVCSSDLVIAFLTWVAENVGEEARFMHQGLTSSDVLDTCLAVQLTQAADILLADLDALLAAIQRRAYEHKLTPTLGRSHGLPADPVTFGLKLAAAYAESSEDHPSEL